jgi:hypothetical protein
MLENWRNRLRTVLDRITGDRKEHYSEGTSVHESSGTSQPSLTTRQPGASTVAINFGIDFGTSFTKVCFRDVSTEESGVVTVGSQPKNGLIPSIVVIGSGGRLGLEHEMGRDQARVVIPYLKMRLAGSPIGHNLPAVDGIDLNNQESTCALASWFLASVIVRSQEWMTIHERDRLKNRVAVWSANVGVPVEHYDSQVLETFRKVLGVAWLWVKDSQIPGTLVDAIAAYNNMAGRLNEEVSDFHAVPEIAAAVQSFVMSREAVPGVYVYFDVGGGTVDGVAFNFLNDQGERRINFYSGKVEPLGIAALANFLGANAPGEVDARQLEEILKRSPRTGLADFALNVQRVVGGVIMTAKKKDGRDWQRDAIQNRGYERKFIGQLQPSQMQPLVIFIGGGGSLSGWYKATIGSTYSDFKHHNAGIPPYKLLQVPKPNDLSMSGLGDGEFVRFAISYGLSIPFGEGPEVRLPSQFSEAPRAPVWTPPGVIDYADSKDVYD